METHSYALHVVSDDVIALPIELARQAGLTEGEVHVTPGEHSLTLSAPRAPALEYTRQWDKISTQLREQAAAFEVSFEDQRDASYWEIVTPLLEQTELELGSI